MPPQFLIRNQRALAATVALAAALRVFLCAAAFPFFTNIDEQYHFDAIVQYANGYRLQPELPRFQPASADMIALYYSNEFGARPDQSIPSPQGWCHPTQESLAQP